MWLFLLLLFISCFFFQFLACPVLTVLPSLSSPFPLCLPSRPFSKTIKVKIIDDEEYEKNKAFYIEIGEPRLVESNDAKGQEEGEPPDQFLKPTMCSSRASAIPQWLHAANMETPQEET